MTIALDQGIMIKICRFIFKTKVLIKIFAKEQHLSGHQRRRAAQADANDLYKNISKAFVVLQSNFQILFGDVVDRDFFQNAKTGSCLSEPRQSRRECENRMSSVREEVEEWYDFPLVGHRLFSAHIPNELRTGTWK